jgi:hypothetical protein
VKLEQKRAAISRRAHQRFPTAFEGRLARLGKLIVVQVVDVSVRGAQIRLSSQDVALRVGERVTLLAGTRELEATVARHTGDSYGLHFLADIAPLQLVRENYVPLRRLFDREPADASLAP